MDIDIAPGTYVVAVSGGVDSMALLDRLTKLPNIRLIVAHYDHGIRDDSNMDRELVQHVAKKHGLPFVYHEGKLGPAASEEQARKARYDFLHQVRGASGAKAVITAHHHNDALETAVMNMVRGTGRKGLTSLRSRGTVHRPALHIEKQKLREYAHDQGLVWREDITNKDTRYLRNYIRHKLMPQLDSEAKSNLATILRNMDRVNRELDEQLLHYLHIQPALHKLDRKTFCRLPHGVAKEVMAAWLRREGIRDFDQKTLDRIVINAKVLAPGKFIDVLQKAKIQVSREHLKLVAGKN